MYMSVYYALYIGGVESLYAYCRMSVEKTYISTSGGIPTLAKLPPHTARALQCSYICIHV